MRHTYLPSLSFVVTGAPLSNKVFAISAWPSQLEISRHVSGHPASSWPGVAEAAAPFSLASRAFRINLRKWFFI